MRIKKHKNKAICELLVEHNLSGESQSPLEKSQYRTQDRDTGTELCLTRYWVPVSALWKCRQLWGKRLNSTLMRLWYQETVMVRKHS